MSPTYYVRHPDGTLSVAQPQPTAEQIAEQANVTYALCDRSHAGGVCPDPRCHLAPEEMVRAAAPELLDVLKGILKCERGMLGHLFLERWQEEVVRAAIAKAEGK